MSNCTATITLQLLAFQPREHSLPIEQKERGNLPRCDFLIAKLYLHPPQTNDTTEHGKSVALGDAGEVTFHVCVICPPSSLNGGYWAT
jgi:hypothetical protein